MNTRWTLIWRGSGLMCTVALILGMLLVPHAYATGSAQSNLATPAKATGDSAWSALGTGVNGEVLAIAVSGNDVYVGGMFDSAGTCITGCTNIAKWNMTTNTWSALGTGVDGEVFAIAVSGNNVYVGGTFGQAGFVSANRIAVWDGSMWSALGTGTNETVRAIAIGNGGVYAGGEFTEAGGCTGAVNGCNFIAYWNGASWSALGTGMDSYVFALADGGTVVYAGGGFDSAGGVPNTYGIASWDNPFWYALGTGMTGVAGYSVNAIAVSGSDIYAGGTFDSAGGVAAINIAKWNNGSGWSALDPGIGDTGAVNAIAVSGSNVYAGGDFQDNDNGAPNHIAKWNNGSGWSALGQGTDGTVYAIAVSGMDIYVGGSFNHAGGKDNTHAIAKYSIASFNYYLPLLIRSE